jgi:hypothetical protein
LVGKANQKINEEEKEETNIHQPFFVGGIFATWQ